MLAQNSTTDETHKPVISYSPVDYQEVPLEAMPTDKHILYKPLLDVLLNAMVNQLWGGEQLEGSVTFEIILGKANFTIFAHQMDCCSQLPS